MTIRRSFQLRPKTELKAGSWGATVDGGLVTLRHDKRGHVTSNLGLADIEKVIDLLQAARREIQTHAEQCLRAAETESELIVD